MHYLVHACVKCVCVCVCVLREDLYSYYIQLLATKNYMLIAKKLQHCCFNKARLPQLQFKCHALHIPT